MGDCCCWCNFGGTAYIGCSTKWEQEQKNLSIYVICAGFVMYVCSRKCRYPRRRRAAATLHTSRIIYGNPAKFLKILTFLPRFMWCCHQCDLAGASTATYHAASFIHGGRVPLAPISWVLTAIKRQAERLKYCTETVFVAKTKKGLSILLIRFHIFRFVPNGVSSV